MFTIFKLALKRNFMNIPITVVLIFFPLLLIYILGNALEGMQESGITLQENVGFYNQLQGVEAESLNQLMTDDQFGEIFIIEQVNEKSVGLDGVENGDFTSFIFAEKIGQQVKISLVTTNKNTPLATVLRSFTETANLAINASRSGLNWQLDTYNQEVFSKSDDNLGSPKGIDYYCVQSLLQSLIFGGLFGIFTVLEDNDKNTYVRVKVSPVSRRKVMGGRIAANTIYITSIAMIVMSCSTFFLGANWNGNPVIIFLVMVLMALIINGVGMVFAAITNSTGLAIGLLTVALMLWSKASGAYGPEPSDSIFAVLSPNFNAKNILYATIYGGSQMMMFRAFGWMMIIMCATYLVFFIVEGSKRNGDFQK